MFHLLKFPVLDYLFHHRLDVVSSKFLIWILLAVVFKKIKKNERLLTTSSTISLIALTDKINISGTRVVYLPVGETSGICCNKAINRKKQFE